MRLGSVSAAEAASEFEHQIVSGYQDLERRADGLTPESGQTAEFERLAEYVSLRRLGCQAIADAIRADDFVKWGVALERLDKARAVFADTVKGRRPAGTAEPSPNLTAVAARFALMESHVMQRYNEALSAEADSSSDAILADNIDKQVLRTWQDGLARLRRVRPLMPAEDRIHIDRLVEYMQLREESWRLLIDGLREGSEDKISQSQQKSQQADDLAQGICNAILKPQFGFRQFPALGKPKGPTQLENVLGR